MGKKHLEGMQDERLEYPVPILTIEKALGMLPTKETAEIEAVNEFLVGWEADEHGDT